MKRKIKKKKKSSFINDSSSEEEEADDDNDPEYLPKTRASKRKALMLKKITP